MFNEDLVPCTGTLTITTCSGESVTFNAPFSSPQAFTIPGIDADGTPNCSVSAQFSDDPENCTMTSNTFTEPICPCVITNFSATIGNCVAATDAYSMSGTVTFQSPPTTGVLTITVDNGTTSYDTIINAIDFISPLDFSISGIPSDETATTITAAFSDDAGCVAALAYTAPPSCACDADIGTFGITDDNPTNNDFVLCFGDVFSYQSNGDYTAPADINDGDPYNPGIAYLIYSCPPTPGIEPNADPCIEGIYGAGTGLLLLNETNNLGLINAFPPGTFTDNVVYYVPITMYDIVGNIYSNVVAPNPTCYDLGPAIGVQYLPEIKFIDAEDCQAGSVELTITGGLPEIDGSNFNVVAGSLLPANASFDNTTAPHGGTITISGLTNGQNYSFNIVDDNGCPLTVTGTFIGTEDAGFSYDNYTICTNGTDPVLNVTGDAGTFSSALTSGVGPTLSINATTGAIDASASDPGTYDVTYTTNDGICFSDSVVSITINITPVADPILDQTVCAGFDFNAINFTGTAGSVYNWTNNNTLIGLGANGGGDMLAFTGMNASNAQLSSTITVTPTLGTCVGDPITFDLFVNPIPVVDAGVDQTVCEPNGITLTATNPDGAVITWDNGVVDGNAFTPAIGTVLYTVTATLTGCVSTDIVNATVNPLPVVNAGIDQTVCENENVTLTATNPDGATISWDNGVNDAISFTPTVGTTSYTVTADLLTCISTDIVDVTVNPLPVFTVAGTDPTTCGGNDGFITISGLTASTLYQISYDDGAVQGPVGMNSDGAGEIVITGLTAGNYTGFVVTLLGCTTTDNAIINLVDPSAPNVDAGVDQTICALEAVTLTAINPDGAVITWDNGITDGIAFNPAVGTLTYTVTATLLGCTSTDVVDVTVNPLPTIDAGVDITICEGVDTLLTAINPDGAVVTWDNGITDGVTFTPPIGTTTTYTVTADLLTCISTDVVDVTVNPLPVFAVVGTDPTTCGGNDGFITISGLNASTLYQISYDDGTVQGPVGMNSDVAGDIVITGLAAGNYTDFIVSLSDCPTTDNSIINLVDPSAPIVDAGIDQTVCDPLAVTLTATNPNGATITWDNGVTDGVAFNPAVGTLTYTVTADLANCITTDVVDVTVNPLPIVNAGADQTVCDGSAVTLIANNPDGANITWDNGVTNLVAFTPAVGTLTYTVTADLLGCISTDAVDIIVNELPMFTVAGTDPTTCGGNDGFITISGLNASTSYQISYNDGNVVGPTTMNSDVTGDIVITGLAAGNYTDFIASLLNCPTTDISVINLVDPNAPIVNAGVDQTVCDPSGVTLTATNPDGAVIVWDNSVTDGVEFNPAVGTLTYTVTANLLGCISTDVVDVTVNPLPTIDGGVDVTVCDGAEVVLTAINPDAATINWDNGVVDGVGFTPAVGTLTYTVTADLLSCISTDVVDVTVNPLGNPGFSYPAYSYCSSEADPTATMDVVGGSFSFVATTGGPNLSIDVSTGLIDLDVSNPGIYEITYTTVGPCPQDSTITMSIASTPTVDLIVDQVICHGEDFTLIDIQGSAGTVFNWTNDNTTIGLAANGMDDIVSFTGINTTLIAQTSSIEVTPSAGTCAGTPTTFNLTVNPLDNAGFNYPVSSFCTTDMNPTPTIDLLGGTFTSFTTSGSGTLDINVATGEINLANSDAGVYSITYTTPGPDCPQDSVVSVTINLTPVVNMTVDQLVCEESSFVNIDFTGSANASFSWVNDNPNIGLAANGTGDIPSFIATTTGGIETANITVTPSTAECIGSDSTFILSVNPLDNPGFNYDAYTYCTADVVDPAANVDVAGGNFTYVVTSGGPNLIIDANSGLIDLDLSDEGVYNITYSTPGPCVQDSTISLTINFTPVVDALTDQTVCHDVLFNTVNFTGNSGVLPITYNWTNDNVAIGLNGNGTGDIMAFTGVNNGAGQVTGVITVTPSTDECTGTPTTFNYIIDPLDIPTFEYIDGLTYCASGAVDPTVNITGTLGGAFVFDVNSGGPTLAFDVNTGNIDLSASDVGSYDVKYQTNGTCPESSTLTVVITDAPVANFSFDEYCIADTDPVPDYINDDQGVPFSPSGSGGIYTEPTGLLSINAVTGEVDLDASTPGTYTITNTMDLAGCATAVESDDIVIYPMPSVIVGDDESFCPNVALPDLEINIAGIDPTWTIIYEFNGALQPFISSQTLPVVIPNTDYGTYEIVSVADGHCTSIVSETVTLSAYPEVSMDPLNDYVFCEDDNAFIDDFQGLPAGNTFDWSFTSGTDVGFGSLGAGNIGTFNAINPQTVTVEVITTTSVANGSCVADPVYFDVTVNPLPTADISANILKGCAPTTIEFSDLVNDGQIYDWTFGNGSTGSGTPVSYTYEEGGTYDIGLTVTNAFGCTASDVEVGYISISEMPVADFSLTPQITNVANTEIEFTNESTNGEEYEWDFGDESDFSNEVDPTYTYDEVPGQFAVTLWAFNNDRVCRDSIQKFVTINDVLLYYVPNVFTPDHDAYNETFKPIFTSGFDPFDYHLIIFNRWGETIFESHDARYGWDGKYPEGDELCADGVYIWKIGFKESMSDKRHDITGHVSLLK